MTGRHRTQLTASATLLAIVSLGCTADGRTEPKKAEPTTVVVAEGSDGIVTPTKFAAVWSWVNAEKNLIDANVARQALQIRNLAHEGTVESVYFDTSPPADAAIGYPSIGFVVNAKSEAAAKALLDQTVFVEKQISTYTLHPVGDKWLGQPPTGGAVGRVARRFVTVWTTTRGPDVQARIDELATTQTDAILELWRSGVIENVYFDGAGVYQDNDTVDFVFFVRAQTEEMARKVADSLPFTSAGLAKYEVHQVGAPLY